VVDGVWTVRKEEPEKGHIEKVALPQLALDIIGKQPKVIGNPYVFAGRGRGPLNSFSQRKQEMDAKLAGQMDASEGPWTLHDLRRTARSLMDEIGVLPHIAERVLGHALLGVARTYNRYNPLAERSEALAKLAQRIGRDRAAAAQCHRPGSEPAVGMSVGKWSDPSYGEQRRKALQAASRPHQRILSPPAGGASAWATRADL
jgi:hypothetical protein